MVRGAWQAFPPSGRCHRQPWTCVSSCSCLKDCVALRTVTFCLHCPPVRILLLRSSILPRILIRVGRNGAQGPRRLPGSAQESGPSCCGRRASHLLAPPQLHLLRGGRWPDGRRIPREHQARLERAPHLSSLCSCQRIPHPSKPPWNSQGSRLRASPGVRRWERALRRLGTVGRGWAEAGGVCQDNPGQAVLALDASQRRLVFPNHHQLPGRRKKKEKEKQQPKQPPNFFCWNLLLMVDWLYIIKQAAGVLPV